MSRLGRALSEPILVLSVEALERVAATGERGTDGAHGAPGAPPTPPGDGDVEVIERYWRLQVTNRLSDRIYEVHIDEHNHERPFDCSCMDCRSRSVVCKHLLYLVHRVAQCQSVAEHLAAYTVAIRRVNSMLSVADWRRLNDGLERVRARPELIPPVTTEPATTATTTTPGGCVGSHGSGSAPRQHRIAVPDRPALEVVVRYASVADPRTWCNDACAICYDDLPDLPPANEPYTFCVAKCKTTLHRKCLQRWIETGRNTCPLCRTRIAAPPLPQISAV
jgi:hypothetical protein